MDIMLSPIETQAGWSVIATVRDIIVRKRVEEELRKSPKGLETGVWERTAELTRANKTLPRAALPPLHANSE